MTNPKHTSSDLVERLRRTVYRNGIEHAAARALLRKIGGEA